MTFESYKAELTSRFSDRLKGHQVWFQNVGMYAVLFAETMLAAPAAMVRCENSHRSHWKAPNGCMGQLIKNKLAVFVPEERHYVLTELGLAWLAKLKARGLLKTARQFADAVEDFKKREVAVL